mmetsp:Transcript_17518/g.41242  ORF Transcript_17518/g.41242 Transcript_17518/m.41242 type:complete len:258 (-) Transcript_17518:1585-2358(-)
MSKPLCPPWSIWITSRDRNQPLWLGAPVAPLLLGTATHTSSAWQAARPMVPVLCRCLWLLSTLVISWRARLACPCMLPPTLCPWTWCARGSNSVTQQPAKALTLRFARVCALCTSRLIAGAVTRPSRQAALTSPRLSAKTSLGSAITSSSSRSLPTLWSGSTPTARLWGSLVLRKTKRRRRASCSSSRPNRRTAWSPTSSSTRCRRSSTCCPRPVPASPSGCPVSVRRPLRLSTCSKWSTMTTLPPTSRPSSTPLRR